MASPQRQRHQQGVVSYTDHRPTHAKELFQLAIQVTTGVNELRGTYFHPDLLLDVASWVSPIILIRTARFINEWRLLSPENDRRFHKEIGEALQKGILMNEHTRSEADTTAIIFI